jgi:hypothetical protein
MAASAEYFGPSDTDVLSTAPSVRAKDAAVVTQSDVLRENRLPPGKYLLSVSLSGSGNWDRQTLYFQVVE